MYKDDSIRYDKPRNLTKLEWVMLAVMIVAISLFFGVLLFKPLEAPILTEKQKTYQEHCKDEEYLILRHDLGVVTLNCNL